MNFDRCLGNHKAPSRPEWHNEVRRHLYADARARRVVVIKHRLGAFGGSRSLKLTLPLNQPERG